jgi:uncharacterized membrane protein YkvA (DUF1232 family)
MSSKQEIEQRFVETMSSWLASLPHDLKILYEAMDDENLARPARETAVGAIVYTVSPHDFVSDRKDSFASYSDDCLVLRIALREIVSKGDEDSEAFKDRFSEFFDGIDEKLALCEQVMGDLYPWLKTKVAGLRTRQHRGKKTATYIDDDEAREALYEDGLAFRTEYPVDEETLSDRLKRASTILDVMRRRKAEDSV